VASREISSAVLKLSRQKNNGRFFDGRKIVAELYTGKQRFRKSGTNEDSITGEGDDEKERLEEFAQWLMDEGE